MRSNVKKNPTQGLMKVNTCFVCPSRIPKKKYFDIFIGFSVHPGMQSKITVTFGGGYRLNAYWMTSNDCYLLIITSLLLTV